MPISLLNLFQQVFAISLGFEPKAGDERSRLNSGILRSIHAILPMKVIAKTPTYLLLQRNLRRRDILFLFLFTTVWTSAWVYAFFVPGRMQLQCQRSTEVTACEVTFWNMLNFHSSTKSIQLKDARAERQIKSGTHLILETEQGEIEFADGMDASFVQQQIREFLNNSTQPNLNVQIVQPWTLSGLKIVCLIGGIISLPRILKLPINIEWQFVLEADRVVDNRQRTSGQIHRTFQGLDWESYSQYEFTDVIAVDTYLSKRSCHLSIKLRSGDRLALSPLGLSKAEWQEVTEAISEMLHIAQPQFPGKLSDR